MNKNKYSSFQIKYLQSQNLQDYIKYFSCYVWEVLKFHAEDPKHNIIGETTLNQLFFLGLAKLMEHPLNLRLFHAREERVNGNDFEIFIEIAPNKFIYFPCQAKRTYANEEYQAISHPRKSDKREQILNLIDYAKGNGLPMYLLFNYSKNNFDTLNYSKELLGCTFLDAFFIKEHYFDTDRNKLKSVYFKDLYPPAKPLISILDLINSDFPTSIRRLFDTLKILPNLRYYTESEISSNGLFIETNPSKDVKKGMFVGGNKLEALWREDHKTYNSDFLPRYRILLTIETIVERKTNFLSKITINQDEQYTYSTN